MGVNSSSDTLQDPIDSAIEDVKQRLLEYLKDNPETDETPDLGNDLDYTNNTAQHHGPKWWDRKK